MNASKRRIQTGLVLISFGIITSNFVLAQEKPGVKQVLNVTASSLRNNAAVVVGDLGLSLGTPAEIEATVAEKLSPFTSERTGFLLRVEKVNGKELKEPPTLEFYARSLSMAKLAGDDSKLEELLRELQEPGNGLVSKPLSQAEAEAFKRNYVGSRHKLAVYEAASFDGIPAKLPDGCMIWADHAFGFHTYLVVMVERKL